MSKSAAALHILVKDRQLADDLLKQLKQGANFQQLAKKYSLCPSAKKGGDLGEFKQGQMVNAFDKVAFTCTLLQPCGPIKTRFGYHVIKVLWRH